MSEEGYKNTEGGESAETYEKGALSREDLDQKKEFIEELKEKIKKIDENIVVSDEDFDSIEVNKDGQINGHIHALRVRGKSDEYLNTYPILKIIASLLLERGVKVFKDNDNGDLIVVERLDGIDYESDRSSSLYPGIHGLYANSEGPWEHRNSASIFADGRAGLRGKYEYKDGKLVRLYNTKFPRAGDIKENHEVELFSDSDE